MNKTPAAALTSIRRSLLLLLAGSVSVLAATLAFPVVGDYWDDQRDAAQIALIDAERTEFAVAFGLQGLGDIAVGIGLLLLGLAVAPMESTRRRNAARVAGMLGLVVAAGGLSRLLHAALATPEFYVDSVVDDAVVIVAGLALLLSMVTLGVLAWSAPPPKWTAAVLIAGGLLNIVPDLAYVALTVFAIGVLITMRRAITRPPSHAIDQLERTTTT